MTLSLQTAIPFFMEKKQKGKYQPGKLQILSQQLWQEAGQIYEAWFLSTKTPEENVFSSCD